MILILNYAACMCFHFNIHIHFSMQFLYMVTWYIDQIKRVTPFETLQLFLNVSVFFYRPKNLIDILFNVSKIQMTWLLHLNIFSRWHLLKYSSVNPLKHQRPLFFFSTKVQQNVDLISVVALLLCFLTFPYNFHSCSVVMLSYFPISFIPNMKW